MHIYICIIWAYYIKGSQQRYRTVFPDCYRWCPMESILSHYTVWWRSISYYGRATTNPHLFIVIQCYSSCSYHSFIFMYQLFSMYLSFISYLNIYIYISSYIIIDLMISNVSLNLLKPAAVLDKKLLQPGSSKCWLHKWRNLGVSRPRHALLFKLHTDQKSLKLMQRLWISKVPKKIYMIYIYIYHMYHMYHICDISC